MSRFKLIEGGIYFHSLIWFSLINLVVLTINKFAYDNFSLGLDRFHQNLDILLVIMFPILALLLVWSSIFKIKKDEPFPLFDLIFIISLSIACFLYPQVNSIIFSSSLT